METRLLETKFTSNAAGEFSGLGSTFGNVDRVGDIVVRGAFQKSLADHRSAGTSPALLWAHDPTQPIGKWTSLTETDQGLAVAGQLTLEVPKATEARALMRDGVLSLSIGYMAKDFGFDRDGNRLLKAVDLVEISAVAIPANPKATIGAVKDIREFETKLRDVFGFSVREARRLASGGWKALTHDDSTELQALVGMIRSSATKWR